MKPRSIPLVLLLALGAHIPLAAQDEILRPFRTEDGTPVRRAIPVRPPRPLPEEPVEERPGREAVPVATPIPRETPPAEAARPPEPPPRRPAPVEQAPPPAEEPPKRQPERPQEEEAPAAKPSQPAAVNPEPSDPGEIRITPRGTSLSPDQAQLAIADSFYARKMYDMAAPEYQRYLELYPGGPDRQTAYFRLGECYRIAGSLNAARDQYELLLSHYRDGEFVGPAAYRLGNIYYESKNYSAALPLFRKASVRVRELPVAYAARFYAARCMEALGQRYDARLAYEELVQFKEGNPFQDASRHALALLLKEANRTTDALKHIQQLAKSAASEELRAEATVRTGLWELDLKQPEKAAATLKKALEMPGIGKWKEIAQLGLIRMLYDTGKFEQVIKTFNEQGGEFTPETKPELLLLAANAQRQLGNFDKALEGYNQLLQEFPKSTFAQEASYERLVCLYNAEDEQLATAIDEYLAANPESDKRDQVLLMKAEALFKKQDYAAAAPLYAQADKSRKLSSALRAEALFKLGWCSMQTGNLDAAIQAFSEFLDGFRDHKSVPYALVQRAIAYQTQKNLQAAEKDFSDLIRKFPKAKERELALQQKALIRGQMNDNAAMAETFKTLIKDFPKSAALAQAHYWVGWAGFEAKNYKEAAEHLAKARELDSEEYFERGSLRIMLSRYHLDQRDAVAREVELYKKEGKAQVPEEILRWLGEQYYKEKDYANAEKFLAMLASREEVKPADLLQLAKSRLELEQFPEATQVLTKYLTTVKEPPSRALGLLDLARAQIGAKDFSAAQSSVDEAIRLQPEGRLTGEARISAGDIKAAQGQWMDAAKLYTSVSVILDHEEVTPRALEKAVEAYRKAGNEEEADKILNTLLSRYPEYGQSRGLTRHSGN